MNLFYGLRINIRDSEVGSQTYLRTYGDLLIFSGRVIVGKISSCALRLHCIAQVFLKLYRNTLTLKTLEKVTS